MATGFDEAWRDIAHRIASDDPGFARRVRGWERAARANTIIVFVLLAAAALLLAGGLATYSWFALAAGAVAFVSAFAVDSRHRWRLTRAPRSG